MSSYTVPPRLRSKSTQETVLVLSRSEEIHLFLEKRFHVKPSTSDLHIYLHWPPISKLNKTPGVPSIENVEKFCSESICIS